jgi:hypothetical protein
MIRLPAGVRAGVFVALQQQRSCTTKALGQSGEFTRPPVAEWVLLSQAVAYVCMSVWSIAYSWLEKEFIKPNFEVSSM